MPGVKVCGITRRLDAEAAAAAGADHLGVVLAPGGRRTVSAAAARVLLDALPVRRVGVFVDAAPDTIRRDAEAAALQVLQLHGGETPELTAALVADGWMVWKAVRVRSGDDFADAVRRYAGAVHALLLDGWSPRAHGGTGTRFPWAQVAELRDHLPAGVELVVAGGLSAGNVGEAVRRLRPHRVDVSSGVENAPGHKDAARIRRFVAAARGAHTSPSPLQP